MYKVHTGNPADDSNYYGERPDPNDNYYIVKNISEGEQEVYELEMLDGLSEFPSEDVFRSRLLTEMEI
jgi:hypothetical protein